MQMFTKLHAQVRLIVRDHPEKSQSPTKERMRKVQYIYNIENYTEKRKH